MTRIFLTSFCIGIALSAAFWIGVAHAALSLEVPRPLPKPPMVCTIHNGKIMICEAGK